MAKRLKFTRGADEFVDNDVTFVCGGPGHEVADSRYELLKGLTDYDFVDESEEEHQERVAAAEKLAAEQAAAEAAQVPAREAEIAQAQRTGDFYNAQSVAEQEAKGVRDPDAGRPATADGVGGVPVPDDLDESADGGLEALARDPDPDPDEKPRRGLRNRPVE